MKDNPPEPQENINAIFLFACVLIVVLFLGGNPTPPGPGPSPPDVVTPIVTGKIRVLIVYDELDRTIPTDKRLAYSGVIGSPDVRRYLAERCAVESSGVPAYRISPPNADFSRDDPFWKAAIAVKHDGITVPYVVIYRDDKGYVSPLPSSSAAMLDLLKKYGGA